MALSEDQVSRGHGAVSRDLGESHRLLETQFVKGGALVEEACQMLAGVEDLIGAKLVGYSALEPALYPLTHPKLPNWHTPADKPCGC